MFVLVCNRYDERALSLLRLHTSPQSIKPNEAFNCKSEHRTATSRDYIIHFKYLNAGANENANDRVCVCGHSKHCHNEIICAVGGKNKY